MKFVIYCDGACDPNPGGAAGFGFVILQGMRRLHEEAGVVGRGEGMTSNVAEYTALIRALEHVRGLVQVDSEVEIRADSELLVRQINKVYAVKAPHIARLHAKATGLLEGLRWVAVHIPREENFEADKLSKQGLDMARRTPLGSRQAKLGGRP